MEENMSENKVESEIKVENVNKVESDESKEKKFDKGIIKVIVLGIIFVICLIFGILKLIDLYNESNFYVPVKNENEERTVITHNEMTKSLYNNIYKGTIDSIGMDSKLYLYRDTKVELESVSSLYLYLAITSNMKFEDVKTVMMPILPDEDVMPEDGNLSFTTETKVTYNIDLDLFADTVKKLYGSYVFTPKIRLTQDDFSVVNGLGLLCQSADNDYIYCDTKVNVDNQDKIYGYVTKVEESESYYYIYEKVLYVDMKENNMADVYSGKDLISSNYDVSGFENKTDEEIIKSIDDGKVKTYMHKFKKDGNNAYWLSVELVK